LFSRGIRIVMASGDQFRRLRKAVHTHLQSKAAQTYQDMQSESARGFILDILDDPKNHQEHAMRYALVTSFRENFINYGYTQGFQHLSFFV
jgi:cytochrome P450